MTDETNDANDERYFTRLAAAFVRGKLIRIVYLETPEANWSARNRARATSVPASVISKLFSRWGVPDWTEAHQVEWIVQ